ncbi:hypothetical protein BH23ACT5_BH23ACT5_08790 [soil metagenome]
MMRRVVLLAWLTLVWVALWEDFTAANLVGGLLVALLVSALIPPRPPVAVHGFRLPAAIKLSIYFTWKLIEASATLAWEVVTPRNRVKPAVVAVTLRGRSPATATMVANMVSLTPGTLTLEVDEDTMTLCIHVLHLDTFDAARREVLKLETLAVDAFPVRQIHERDQVGPGSSDR